MKRCRHCHSVCLDHLEHCTICGSPDFLQLSEDDGREQTPEEIFMKVVTRHVIDPLVQKLYIWQWEKAISLQQPGHTPGENRTDDSPVLQYEEE